MLHKAKTAKDLRKHVKRRAYERFGITLNLDQINQFTKLIQAGKAEFYDRQSNNVTRWIIPIKDLKVAVAYDKSRKCIRTVMPVEFLSQEPPARS